MVKLWSNIPAWRVSMVCDVVPVVALMALAVMSIVDQVAISGWVLFQSVIVFTSLLLLPFVRAHFALARYRNERHSRVFIRATLMLLTQIMGTLFVLYDALHSSSLRANETLSVGQVLVVFFFVSYYIELRPSSDCRAEK